MCRKTNDSNDCTAASRLHHSLFLTCYTLRIFCTCSAFLSGLFLSFFSSFSIRLFFRQRPYPQFSCVFSLYNSGDRLIMLHLLRPFTFLPLRVFSDFCQPLTAPLTRRCACMQETTSGWAKKPDCFLKVCNSRICRHTIAFYISICSVFYPQ